MLSPWCAGNAPVSPGLRRVGNGRLRVDTRREGITEEGRKGRSLGALVSVFFVPVRHGRGVDVRSVLAPALGAGETHGVHGGLRGGGGSAGVAVGTMAGRTKASASQVQHLFRNRTIGFNA